MVVQFHRNDHLRQYRACVIDSLGLGIIYMHLISLYCVQAILILSPFLFTSSLYSTFYFDEFYITCPLLFLNTIPNAADHIDASIWK